MINKDIVDSRNKLCPKTTMSLSGTGNMVRLSGDRLSADFGCVEVIIVLIWFHFIGWEPGRKSGYAES